MMNFLVFLVVETIVVLNVQNAMSFCIVMSRIIIYNTMTIYVKNIKNMNFVSLNPKGHSFTTYAKFSEKLTFFPP